MEELDSFKEKTFLITGSEGLIGKDLCKRLSSRGAYVIACDIQNKKNSDDFQKEFLKCDLTNNNGFDDFSNYINNFNRKIDGFVHCAYPRPKSWGKFFEQISLDEVNLHLNYQLGSSIFLSKIICQYLQKNKGGKLVHISSIQGIAAPKFQHYEGTHMSSPIEYSCIKSSIILMTKWLAKYYKKSNLNINCISPGGVIDSQPEIFQNNYKLDCNSFGLLEPKNVSDAIIFLLSEEAKAISGQNLIVDDGWSL